MKNSLKVGVVGLGTMGAMAAWQLAKQGATVEGFEQYSVGHNIGAAGGATRMFRMVYAEGQRYAPLLDESQALWAQLEHDSGVELFVRNGVITINDPGSAVVKRSLSMAEATGTPHSILSPIEVRRLFPGYGITDSEVAVWDPSGGVIRSNLSLMAAAKQAQIYGATLHEWSEVEAVEEDGDSVSVFAGGARYTFDAVVITTGPWIGEHFSVMGIPMDTRRARTSFHAPYEPVMADPLRSPCALRRLPDGRSYGLMNSLDGTTIKVVIQSSDANDTVDPQDAYKDVHSATYIREVISLVSEALPGLVPAPVATGAHPEGFTRDSEPVVGKMAGKRRTFIAGGFSGQGFKFATGIGAEIARMVLDQGNSLLPDTFSVEHHLKKDAADSELANLWFDNGVKE